MASPTLPNWIQAVPPHKLWVAGLCLLTDSSPNWNSYSSPIVLILQIRMRSRYQLGPQCKVATWSRGQGPCTLTRCVEGGLSAGVAAESLSCPALLKGTGGLPPYYYYFLFKVAFLLRSIWLKRPGHTQQGQADCRWASRFPTLRIPWK